MNFDPRLTPAREDLAADFLRSVVKVPRYAKGVRKQVITPVAPLRSAPRNDAGLSTELLTGEGFTVYDEADGWAWGQAALDDYVGYLPVACLGEMSEPTHVVRVLRSFVYPRPDLKAPPVSMLSFGAQVTVKGAPEGKFLAIGPNQYVFAEHLRSADVYELDYVTSAVRFVGTPYLWGGRSSMGVDCSGLVQLALQSAGIFAPRDSDMQAKGLGRDVGTDARDVEPADLIFFPGHVGIMVDQQTILHANAWDMLVSPHPLTFVLAEIRKEHAQPITAIRRLRG